MDASQLSEKIKHLHERYQRLAQNDKLSSYEELLGKDESVSVHHINIQGFAIEMLQIKHDQSREIIVDKFMQTTQE